MLSFNICLSLSGLLKMIILITSRSICVAANGFFFILFYDWVVFHYICEPHLLYPSSSKLKPLEDKYLLLLIFIFPLPNLWPINSGTSVSAAWAELHSLHAEDTNALVFDTTQMELKCEWEFRGCLVHVWQIFRMHRQLSEARTVLPINVRCLKTLLHGVSQAINWWELQSR